MSQNLSPWPFATGELPDLIRSFNWAATALGPISGWSAEIKAVVDTVLSSPLGMVLLCGPEGVMIYNQGYAAVCQDRHPGALGLKVLEVWPEASEFNGNVLRSVLAGESLSFFNSHHRLLRAGALADCFYDLFYSPVQDRTGAVWGVLAVVVETTARVSSERKVAEAEAALRDSQERLSLALEASQFPGIWDWDVVNDRIVTSQRFAQLYGVDPERARQGVSIVEFYPAIHPEDRGGAAAVRRAATEHGGRYTQEYRVLQKDGGIRWVKAYGHAHSDATGTVVRIAGILVDITAERTAQEEIRRSEERLRLALEATYAFGTWDWDVRADVVTADEAFGNMFLLTPEQSRMGVPIGRLFLSIHPDDLLRVRTNIDGALRDGGKFSDEYRLLNADGTVRWISVRGHVQRDANGAPLRFPGVGVDVTAEHRALDALRESEAFTRSILDSSPDSVEVLDLAGTVLTINRAGLVEMEYLSDRECLGKRWVDLLGPGLRAGSREALKKACNGETFRFDGFSETAKGNPKWWEFVVAPVFDNGGAPLRILVIARDITERRRAEEQLRQAAKLESLGVMAGGIAHDFNNLLTGILGNASMLAESVSDADQSIAAEIVTAAQRAAHLTRQMLAYSGKGRFFLQKLDISQQVREILPLLKPLIEKTVQIELKLEKDLAPVYADVAQVQQLIMNIALNAAEALEAGAGTVTLSTAMVEAGEGFSAETFAEGPLAPGAYISFSVRDTGIGMSPGTLRSIFDPFFTTKFTGRGLGLAAVSGIVRGHKGGVRIESEPGVGTSFEVLLPAAGPVPHTGPPKRTILFVDDEETVRRFAKTALERAGFAVIPAEDGQHALDLLASAKDTVHLVVLDMMMPVLGGEAAFERIRELCGGLPVLVSSGYNEGEVIRRFSGVQIASFLQKPYTASQLLEKVREYLKD